VRADQRRVVLRGHLREPVVEAAPGVVEQVGARPADLAPHLRAPGVHADDQVRELLADGGDERHGAPDLLGGVDDLARAGLHAADVHQVRSVGDHGPDPLQGLVLGIGRAPVVERVPGAVHDRHHQQVGVVEGPVSELQHVREATRERSADVAAGGGGDRGGGPPGRASPKRSRQTPGSRAILTPGCSGALRRTSGRRAFVYFLRRLQ
jgi:hypothetical protein